MQERIQNQQPEQSSRDPSQRVLQQDNSQVIVSNSNQSHPHVDNHVIPDREFLPLCDLLFNLISLLLYIFDVLFDVVIIRSLYHDSSFSNYWWKTMFFFVILSLTVSQYLSFIWWRKTCNQDESMVIGQGSHSRGISHQHNSSMKDKAVSLKIVLTSCCRDQHDPECSSECSPLSRYHDRSLPFLMSHVLQFGIILRYLRLFIPVNLLTIKHEVRDLCMLRMVHAFTQAAPMLLMQVSTSHRTQYCVSQVNTILTYLTFSGIPGLCEVESGRRNWEREDIDRLISDVRLLGSCKFLQECPQEKPSQTHPDMVRSHLSVLVENRVCQRESLSFFVFLPFIIDWWSSQMMLLYFVACKTFLSKKTSHILHLSSYIIFKTRFKVSELFTVEVIYSTAVQETSVLSESKNVFNRKSYWGCTLFLRLIWGMNGLWSACLTIFLDIYYLLSSQRDSLSLKRPSTLITARKECRWDRKRTVQSGQFLAVKRWKSDAPSFRVLLIMEVVSHTTDRSLLRCRELFISLSFPRDDGENAEMLQERWEGDFGHSLESPLRISKTKCPHVIPLSPFTLLVREVLMIMAVTFFLQMHSCFPRLLLLLHLIFLLSNGQCVHERTVLSLSQRLQLQDIWENHGIKEAVSLCHLHPWFVVCNVFLDKKNPQKRRPHSLSVKGLQESHSPSFVLLNSFSWINTWLQDAVHVLSWNVSSFPSSFDTHCFLWILFISKMLSHSIRKRSLLCYCVPSDDCNVLLPSFASSTAWSLRGSFHWQSTL